MYQEQIQNRLKLAFIWFRKIIKVSTLVFLLLLLVKPTDFLKLCQTEEQWVLKSIFILIFLSFSLIYSISLSNSDFKDFTLTCVSTSCQKDNRTIGYETCPSAAYCAAFEAYES